ncbi:MAG: NADH-quinone oxidoreductase subunit NuoB [Candidatus Riflebacteria bacterium]|nr:NADH-quinone oxidoreductase subunit NuoB [Candidatus Riflebacteria bacterium]NLV94047.1 NADH-quinone oxidoreductase subunit NuoB [Candidatus Riflebacteria bacterium]
MLKVIKARIHQQNRTYPFPQKMPAMDPRYAGRPIIKADKCQAGCQKCVDLCPTQAVSKINGKITIDLGRCLFCRECEVKCPGSAISFTNEFSMGANTLNRLKVTDENYAKLEEMGAELKRLFGRSLKLRQVSAGGCNACEADCNVLTTPTFDMARFGITFVASPRHADGLLVTGPVTQNMKQALIKAYQALPAPAIVIATGACAISGGLFKDNFETNAGIGDLIPVDLYVPGCPPNPWTILDAMLRFMGAHK